VSQQKPDDPERELVHPWTPEEVEKEAEELMNRPWQKPKPLLDSLPPPDLTVVDPD
jgi:hypothetical protein